MAMDVPTVEETKDSALESGKAALGVALANRVGSNFAGPLGGMVGAAAAGSYMDSSQAQNATTIAFYDGISAMMAGNPQASSGNTGAGDI